MELVLFELVTVLEELVIVELVTVLEELVGVVVDAEPDPLHALTRLNT